MARIPVQSEGKSQGRRYNTIITRGFGRRQQIVTQGYGGILAEIKAAVTRFITLGQSGAKRAIRELEEIIIGAKLLRVNDEKPKQQIQGHVTVKVDLTRRIAVMAEGVSKRVRAAWEDIKITVKRIR